MNRLDKKCFIASTGTHLLLALLLVFGSAFFVSPDKTSSLPSLKVVPTRFVDDALSGGGGNPKVAPSDAQIKGQTLAPQPTPAPKPIQPPPKPKVKPQVESKKPEPTKPTKKEAVKPPAETAKSTKPDQIILKPVTRSTIDKAKEKADADAKEEREKAAAASRKASREFARAAEELRSGFSKGTVIEVNGPGGEAYANYDQWVREHYDNAWVLTPDLLNDDSTAVVRITIHRSGRVLTAEILLKSGNASLDRSVRRALDKVKFIAPFPEGAREEERTYTIDFNLKTKRLLG